MYKQTCLLLCRNKNREITKILVEHFWGSHYRKWKSHDQTSHMIANLPFHVAYMQHWVLVMTVKTMIFSKL